MKRIYALLSALLLTITLFAQNEQRGVGLLTPNYSIPIERNPLNSNLKIAAADTTTGIGNTYDFAPTFGSLSNNYMWWTFTGGGYCFGNNKNGWNIWAQGYYNFNNMSVKIIGVIAGFRKKEHDIVSASANSAVTFYLFSMAANSAYNTDKSGVYNNTTANFVGPTGSPVATASLLFSAIDTVVNTTKAFPRSNYIPFTTQPTFSGNFAIAMDARGTTTPGAGYLTAGTLAPGDTVALCTDMNGDAADLDYAYTLQGYGGTSPKWIVADQWGSDAASPTLGSGQFDLDIALFAVFSDVTGVEEFFNGMKLTTYPNPSIDKTIIEYTLEKNSDKVKLTVFDEHGGKIIDNEYGSQSAGTYKINVETSNLAAGIYFYQLRANGHNFTKQIVVSK